VDPGFIPRPGSWRVSSGGTAELVADADRPGAYLLVVSGVAQSYIDLVEPTHLEFGYIRLLGALIDLLAEPGAPTTLVHVGGGGASLARYVAATRPGSAQTVIEADEALAQGIRERLGGAEHTLAVGDGRAVLAGLPGGTADGVVTDAFVESRIPGHLTTLEYVREVRRALQPSGWYAVNVADQGSLAYARRVAATLEEGFGHVLLLAEPAVLRGRRFGNLVIVGSDAPLPGAELSRVAAGDATAPARLLTSDGVRRLVAGARPLTDAEPVASPEPPAGVFTVRPARIR
jgi:spermidine synthase